MTLKNKILLFLSCVFLTLIIAFTYYYFFSKKTTKTVGKDASTNITTKEDWDLGLLSNIASYESGNIDISDVSSGNKIEITEDMITILAPTEDATNVIDSDWDTYWQGGPESYGTDNFITIDLGEITPINKIISKYTIANNYIDYGIANFWGSTNGIDYECFEFGEFGNIEYVNLETLTHTYSPAVEYRYFRISSPEVSDCDMHPEWGCSSRLYEIEIYTEGTVATHTTAATQIDGQEGSADKEVIEWTSFTPTQTTPANTSISYEFRTSDDGSSWTSWSAPQTYSGSPLDLTTLTPNRYLQVKATLSNTDGVSTPQIDDYTINFHNNQKPNKPVAQTAVIGN